MADVADGGLGTDVRPGASLSAVCEYAFAVCDGSLTNEVNRLYGVLDARLADREFIAEQYSIADMACWPWIKPYKGQGQDLDQFENLKRWFLALNKRPGIRNGWNVGREWLKGGPVVTEAAKAVLFGQTAIRG